MPRTARASVGDICYHVINQGNAQIEVFHKDGDYTAFVELIGLACQRIPMRGPCLLRHAKSFSLGAVASFG
jgi:putative transposase